MAELLPIKRSRQTGGRVDINLRRRHPTRIASDQGFSTLSL